MYIHFTIMLVEVTWTLCYSNYDIFQGFDMVKTNPTTSDHTTPEPFSAASSGSPKDFSKITENITSSFATTIKANTKPKINCSEESPTNIGTYEVPTGKDVVIFTKELLLNMFEMYERNAMSLLRDIKEVTKATASIENNCVHSKNAYKQCVKRVSGQSEAITKNLVNALELKKIEIKALTDNTICSLSEMKTDPMSIIKLLAQEIVMLKFALPGFLRLLNSCSAQCLKHQAVDAKKPLRQMTDQELVVKYFLTNKNYTELIKDSRRSV